MLLRECFASMRNWSGMTDGAKYRAVLKQTNSSPRHLRDITLSILAKLVQNLHVFERPFPNPDLVLFENQSTIFIQSDKAWTILPRSIRRNIRIQTCKADRGISQMWSEYFFKVLYLKTIFSKRFMIYKSCTIWKKNKERTQLAFHCRWNIREWR